eukprot:CAMPEP_0118676214 /NCGR_PEP_ID=MMETSP0800-20121206/1914_1 /TAXON_ID=210618 ORGANISM="Striatella unipunctata, Strain CCMP2910" /NCGR_SAMPLE_ID=MMETSP0800 /ASSEMBLY_ACC=CAM_ASM_000638 /LENGTH=86 /DNA_ID=CAMNT_0006571685 /DNA_START=307 /DNA_END=567 /DNA_ORIENTATION=+
MLATIATTTNAFSPPQKRTKRTAFRAEADQSSPPPEATTPPMFAMSPTPVPAEVDEEDVSLGTGLAACAFAIVLGFSLGYGTPVIA